jgi:hypothetical protein
MVAAFALSPATGLAQKAGPMVIAKQGAFEAGGRQLKDGDKTLSCDHGYVEYQIPANARKVALFMWHSSSTAVRQTRWDGGEGYQSIFLRRGYPVYLWDGPRVGRGNWGCETSTYKPAAGRDEGNFTAWRFGLKYPDFFPGVQFPTNDPEAWNQATRARYEEFDTADNARLQAEAAGKALDRIGPSVLLTNSAGGMRGLLAAMKSGNVKAIVAYENPGFVFPSDFEAPGRPDGPFGPIIVSPEEFRKLTRIPMQFVFGDNTEKAPVWVQSLATARKFVELVNVRGGKAEILMLPAAGLHGNTHIPFADLNNVAVADLLSQFLKKNGLDVR